MYLFYFIYLEKDCIRTYRESTCLGTKLCMETKVNLLSLEPNQSKVYKFVIKGIFLIILFGLWTGDLMNN